MNAFEQYLLTYQPPMDMVVDKSSANKCLSILNSRSKSQELKEAALWFVDMYYDWTPNQLRRLSSCARTLNEDNQDELVSVYDFMFPEDYSPQSATEFAKGWIRLMRTIPNVEVRAYAADCAACYAHPALMDFALQKFERHEVNERYTLKYFAAEYAWSYVPLDDDPKRTYKQRWKNWWSKKENKEQWVWKNIGSSDC